MQFEAFASQDPVPNSDWITSGGRLVAPEPEVLTVVAKDVRSTNNLAIIAGLLLIGIGVFYVVAAFKGQTLLEAGVPRSYESILSFGKSVSSVAAGCCFLCGLATCWNRAFGMVVGCAVLCILGAAYVAALQDNPQAAAVVSGMLMGFFRGGSAESARSLLVFVTVIHFAGGIMLFFASRAK